MSAHRNSPRLRRAALLGAVAGVTLAIGIPLAASAHVHVDPGEVAAGTTETLAFSFSHGCDGSPTTALVIDIPEGVGNVTPVVQGGWTIARETGDDGVPTQVTFTADSPVDDHLKASVSMDVLFDESAAESTIAFPVVQECAQGETAWVEVAEDGQSADDLEAPAPTVTVGEVAADGDGHSHSAGDSHEHDAGTADAAEPTAAASDADPVARWLAAGGLLAGVAALAVVLVRGRSRKS